MGVDASPLNDCSLVDVQALSHRHSDGESAYALSYNTAVRLSHDECVDHLLDDIQLHESPLPVPAIHYSIELLFVQAVGVPAHE